MTAASLATPRTAIFESCASDHFLNPLVRTVIEIPMISSFFGFLEIIYGDDYQLIANKISQAAKKSF